MARNRQRAKARKSKARQQAQSPSTQEALSSELQPTTDAPDPIAEASGPAELAKAVELTGAERVESGEELVDEQELDELEAEDADDRGIGDGDSGDDGGGGRDIAERPSGGAAGSGAALPKSGNRFFNFIRACWAELKRVQWPTRPQVGQATGVVLGFVIVAGSFLGLMDAVVSRLVNAIL